MSADPLGPVVDGRTDCPPGEVVVITANGLGDTMYVRWSQPERATFDNQREYFLGISLEYNPTTITEQQHARWEVEVVGKNAFKDSPTVLHTYAACRPAGG